jgi:transposase
MSGWCAQGDGCVAIAEAGRSGEVRQLGVFENRPELVLKPVARLSKGGRRLSFCYEAGPYGWIASVAERLRT